MNRLEPSSSSLDGGAAARPLDRAARRAGKAVQAARNGGGDYQTSVKHYKDKESLGRAEVRLLRKLLGYGSRFSNLTRWRRCLRAQASVLKC